MNTYDLEENEELIGVYGVKYRSAYITSFGFIVKRKKPTLDEIEKELSGQITRINTNSDSIAGNFSNISTNSAVLSTNMASISVNTANISANLAKISVNSESPSTNF